jgi:glycosyltransferase involved in cell wall biosynthesis
MDVLCVSSTDWDEIWGSRQQIMLRLAAAGNRVLFVERQVSLEHLLRDPVLYHRKISAWRGKLLRKLSNNIWLWCPPMMLPGRYYSMHLNFHGQRLLATRVHPVLSNLGFVQPILWLYPPHSAPLLGQLGESCSIYHCIDRFSGIQKGLKRIIIERQERLLLQNADIVFTHADGLKKLYQHLTRRPITIIPSAADVLFYQSTASIHPDIAQITHPRIGIMGTFDGRIDVKLLQSLVINHHDWQFVIIGQIRPGRTNLDRLFFFPNVHYLGSRPHQELPSLLNGMDAFLIPYKNNELTKFISPLKLYEYLAVGKPIVSVPLPEVLRLSSHVHIAEPDEFSAKIKLALESDDRTRQQARRDEAWKHTWDIRVDIMMQTINEFFREDRI